jgi:hypothetical protein
MTIASMAGFMLMMMSLVPLVLAVLPAPPTGCGGIYHETYMNGGSYGDTDLRYDPQNPDYWKSYTSSDMSMNSSYTFNSPNSKPCWMYATMAVYKTGVLSWAVRAGPQGIVENDRAIDFRLSCDAALIHRISEVRPTAYEMQTQGIVSWTPIYKICCDTDHCNVGTKTMFDNLFMGIPGGPPITTKAYPYDTSSTPSSSSPVPVDPSASPVDPSASPAAPGAGAASDASASDSSSSSSSSNTGLIVGVVVGVVALAAVVAGVTWWVVRRHRAVNADAKVIPQGV